MVELGIILILILLNGFFVASEFATVAVPRSSMDSLASEGNKPAAAISKILKDPILQDRYIATSQVGITIASLALGMYGEHVIAEWIVHQLGHAIMPEAMVHVFSSVLSVVLLTYFHIVLGEMIPKSLAIQRSKSVMLFLVRPMLFFMRFFRPIVLILNGVNYFILKQFFRIDRRASSIPAFTPEELQLIVKESETEGIISDEIGTVIEQVFSFGDLIAEEIMVPRVNIVALPMKPPSTYLREILRKEPHSRFPVYSGDKDNIVGVVHIKDLAAMQDASEDLPLPMRPVPFVPLTASIEDVLEAMKNLRTHMAVVLDEYGGTAGIITMQDVFEEIVGEIDDTTEATSVKELPDGSFRVDGTVRLDEISELLDINIEEEDIHTIGGLVLDELVRPPKAGDEFVRSNMLVKVVKTRGRGVRLCVVRRVDGPKVEEPDESVDARDQD